MRKKYVGLVLGIAILAVSVAFFSGIARGQHNNPRIPGLPIGAIRMDFLADQLNPEYTLVRTFIETNSTSSVILGTLNECTNPLSIQSVFCSARDYNGKHGIVVTIFLDPPVNADFGVAMTLYQQGAMYYSNPVFYWGD